MAPDDELVERHRGPLRCRGRRAPLPPGADLNRYRLVDISAEAYDGDAAHSGKSLLSRTLTN